MFLHRQINQPRICPRCKKLKIGEDYFCEHCLANLMPDWLEPRRTHTLEN